MLRNCRVIFLLVLIVFVVGTVAVNAQKTTIQWWTFPLWWSGISGEETEEELEALREAGKPDSWGDYMAQKFMELHPEVKIEYTEIPWGEQQKLDIALATNTGADLFYVYPALYGKYRTQNLLEPIGEYITAEDKEDFFEPALEFAKYKGEYYLWPWIYGTEGEWVVNKSIFEERDALDLLPEGPAYRWTVEDLKKAAKELTFTRSDGTKVYGMAFTANAPIGINLWQTWSFIFAFGSPLYDDNNGVTAEIEEDVKKALELMRWFKEEKVTPPGLAGMQTEMVSDLWNRKQVAITFGGLGLINGTRQGLKNGDIEPPLEPLLVSPPVIPGEKLRVSGTAAGFVVNGNVSGEKKEWVMKFAHWITDTEQAKTINVFLPGRKSAVEKVVQDDPLKQWQLEYSLPNLEPYPASEHLNEIADIWKDVLQATLTGRFTPEEGAAEYSKKVNELLNN